MDEKEKAICEQMLIRIADADQATRQKLIDEYRTFLQAIDMRRLMGPYPLGK